MSGIDPEKFFEARKLGKKYINYILSGQTEKASKVKEELDSKGLYQWAFPKAPTVVEEIYEDPLPTSSFELTDLGRSVLSETVKLDKPLRSKKAYFVLSGISDSGKFSFGQLKSKLGLSKAVLIDNLSELVYKGLVDRG